MPKNALQHKKSFKKGQNQNYVSELGDVRYEFRTWKAKF